MATRRIRNCTELFCGLARLNSRLPLPSGRDLGTSLSDNDAAAVAPRLAEGESASALAREFGVSRATVFNTRVRLAASGVIHPSARNTTMKSARIAAAVAANTRRSEPTGETINQ
jgi:hypothetical protein